MQTKITWLQLTRVFSNGSVGTEISRDVLMTNFDFDIWDNHYRDAANEEIEWLRIAYAVREYIERR